MDDCASTKSNDTQCSKNGDAIVNRDVDLRLLCGMMFDCFAFGFTFTRKKLVNKKTMDMTFNIDKLEQCSTYDVLTSKVKKVTKVKPNKVLMEKL